MRKIQATKYLWITLFLLGIFVLPKSAFASTDWSSVILPYSAHSTTYTAYMRGCANGAGPSPCTGTYIFFIDSASYTVQSNGGAHIPILSNGYIEAVNVASSFGLDSTFDVFVKGNSVDIWSCTDTTYSNCSDDGVGDGYIAVNNQGGSGQSSNSAAVFSASLPVHFSATYVYNPPPTDDSTRFISIVPTASSTVATSSATTIGGHVFVNPAHYVEGKTFLRMNFTNFTASLVTGSALQAWDTAFNNGFLLPITASSTDLDISTSTTKFEIYEGKTEGTYQIVIQDCSWYSFLTGCNYNPLIATSTYFYIGGKTGFDISQEAGQLGIFGLAPGSDPFHATTTNAVLDCNIGISFDIYKCLWSFVIPNQYLTNQVVSNYKSLPILGWPIRFAEILITTTATSSLPTINYTFAAHNSFLGGVNIHFNPWQYMYTSGSLVKDQFVADDGSGNIWDIMGPFVKLVVYLTLGFVIIRRLTGLNWGGEYTTTESGSETVSTSEKLPDGARKTYTHSITKRRKL